MENHTRLPTFFGSMLRALVLSIVFHASLQGQQAPRVAYYKDSEIHITVLGKPEAQPITSGHGDFKPSWPVTGDHLVFFRRLKDAPDLNNWIAALCINNTDGSGFHQLSDGTFTDFKPTSTRDGTDTPLWNLKVAGKDSYYIMAGRIGGKPGKEVQITDKAYHSWGHSAIKYGRLFVSAKPPNQTLVTF